MSGVGHEGARVGEHAEEFGEEADVGEGVDLPLHAFFLIDEPPGAAELDLEIAGHCCKGVVVDGIHVVENHFGQGFLGIETVEIRAEPGDLRPIADGIEASVGSDFLEASGIGGAVGSEVELLGPAFFGVELTEEQHHMRGEHLMLFGSCCGSCTDFAEDCGQGGFRTIGGVAVIESMVREAAAEGMEFIVTFCDCVLKTLEAAVCSDAVCPGVEDVGAIYTEGFVGAEGGEDFGGESEALDLFVNGEVVCGIVCGAKSSDGEVFENAVCAEVVSGELFVGLIPDAFCGGAVE